MGLRAQPCLPLLLRCAACRRRTPSYAYALLLLLLLETFLIWRLYPYSSTPLGPTSG